MIVVEEIIIILLIIMHICIYTGVMISINHISIFALGLAGCDHVFFRADNCGFVPKSGTPKTYASLIAS